MTRAEAVGKALRILAPRLPAFETDSVLARALASPGLRNASPETAAWLALVAFARHVFTEYESYLEEGYDREQRPPFRPRRAQRDVARLGRAPNRVRGRRTTGRGVTPASAPPRKGGVAPGLTLRIGALPKYISAGNLSGGATVSTIEGASTVHRTVAMRRMLPIIAGLVLASGAGLAADRAWAQQDADPARLYHVRLAGSCGSRPGSRRPPSPGSIPARPSPRKCRAPFWRSTPVAGADLPLTPSREPKPGTFGGSLRIPPVVTPGLYQVTLSDNAWIDVSQDGATTRKPVASTMRPGCPGISKSVRFQFGTTPILVVVSGAKSDSIKIAVAPAE